MRLVLTYVGSLPAYIYRKNLMVMKLQSLHPRSARLIISTCPARLNNKPVRRLGCVHIDDPLELYVPIATLAAPERDHYGILASHVPIYTS